MVNFGEVGMAEIDCTGTEEIVCPWCGEECGDSWEYTDKNNTEKCYSCGKEFSYEREYSCTYSSEKKKCTGKHAYGLSKEHENPWVVKISTGRLVNATAWICKICDCKKILTGPAAEDGKPYLIDMIE